MINRLAILITLFMLPVLMMAHGNKIPVAFSGIVSEESGAVVPGALISIEKNGEVIQSTQSDENGQFVLKVEGPLDRVDRIKLTVKKKGFRSEEALPLNIDYKNLNIQLQRLREPIPILRNRGVNSGIFI